MRLKNLFAIPFLLTLLALTPAQAELSSPDLFACDGVNSLVAQEVPDDVVVSLGTLDEIQEWLTRFESWGLNPNKVGVHEFDFQLFIPQYDSKFVNLRGVMIALKHSETGKCQAFGIRPFVRSHYPTATRLIQMATPDEE